MPEEKIASATTVSVQGTDNVQVPKEIAQFYEGKGIPFEFFKSHYGIGKGVSIRPQQSDIRTQMFNSGI